MEVKWVPKSKKNRCEKRLKNYRAEVRQIGERRLHKSKKIRNLRPEGRFHTIFWAGPAECADPAEALELASSRAVVQHACAPRGGGGFKRLRAFRRAEVMVCCCVAWSLSCVVARSDAKPSCMLCGGGVGLWCVCVCFVCRVGPKKLPK